MKKIIALIIAVALCLGAAIGLVACNNTPATTDSSLLFGKELLKVSSQVDVLTQLKNGGADIGVMDSIMANYYMTTGSYASDLQLLEGVVLSEEEYGIAAKKGNDTLISKINEALIALATDGSMADVAEVFGLQNEVLVDSDTQNPVTGSDNSWTAVVDSKKLIIGYTEFAPIAYNENNTLTGFDVELAKSVVAYLNSTYSAQIEIEWQLIDWDTKEALLENGSIDLVWNGMTITDERLEGMSISIPYLANKQAAVIKKSDAEKYGTLASFLVNARSAIVAVEAGSAAQDCMEISL